MLRTPVRKSRATLVTTSTITIAFLAFLAGCTAESSGNGETGAVSEPARTVEHARGATEVPAQPQRVVVLEPVQLDTSVALGVMPVGTTVFGSASGAPDYLGPRAAQIEAVGTVPEPSLEAIAALHPDLILGTETRHGEFYEQLSAIAPTVFMASQSDPWQENVDLVATALGKREEASRLLADYDDRCAEIREEFSTEGQTAQLIRPREDILTLYGPTSFAGSTLECAGFTTPDRDWAGEISIDISPELVAQAEADLVVVTSPTPGDPGTLPDVVTNSVAQFPRLHLVDQAYWIAGVGPLGGMTVLDDIEKILQEG
ncbi:ABC transporter substrate-binding protein [Hoyosella altamirensis]|uniref:ABC transporter substrate-binding protein n=1 Tax=Hoyosella altamirensis TaxID=616997 RepID=UPI003C6D7733